MDHLRSAVMYHVILLRANSLSLYGISLNYILSMHRNLGQTATKPEMHSKSVKMIFTCCEGHITHEVTNSTIRKLLYMYI